MYVHGNYSLCAGLPRHRGDPKTTPNIRYFDLPANSNWPIVRLVMKGGATIQATYANVKGRMANLADRPFGYTPGVNHVTLWEM